MEIRSLTVLGVESQNSRVRLPGDPVVKTPCFYCRGAQVQTLIGKVLNALLCSQKKKVKVLSGPCLEGSRQDSFLTASCFPNKLFSSIKAI